MLDRRSILAALGAAPAAALARKLPLAAGSPSFGELDAFVAAELGAGKVPAVAAMLAMGGKVIWERAGGFSDREHAIPAALTTPFSLASVTKPFTTATLMALVANRKLRLDDPVSKYLGEAVREVGNREPVTIRELGAHLSGLPSLFAMYPLGGGGPPPGPDEALQEWGQAAYPPLATYEYSNIGYVALARVAEKVSRRPFRDLITKRLLSPLGLRDSFYVGGPSDWESAAKRYDEKGRVIPFYVTATPPSGELFASVRDVMRFALFNLKALPIKHAPFGSPMIDDLHRPLFSGPHGGVAFGWFTGITASGLPVIFKDGGQPGVSTVVYLVPSLGAACVVLTNQTDPDGWAQDLADRIMGCIVHGWTTPDTSMRSAATPLSSSVPLGRWQGEISGELTGDPERVPLMIDFADATLSIGAAPPQALMALRREGDFLTAKSTGNLHSREAARNAASEIKIKLMCAGDRLEGRLLGVAERPGLLATIPKAVSLRRAA